MRVISPLLKHLVYPGLSKAGCLQRSAKRENPVVVTYHGLLPSGYKVCDSALDGNLVTAQAFRDQLQLLKSKYNVISPQQFRLWCDGNENLPPRSVLLTCDDGLWNVVSEMLPVLDEMKLNCLFFVTSSSLCEPASILWYEKLFLLLHGAQSSSFQVFGESYVLPKSPINLRGLWHKLIRKLSALDLESRERVLEEIRTQLGISEDWQAEYSEDESKKSRFVLMDCADLRMLTESGMTIGAHSVSHPILSQLPREMAYEEIARSKIRLQGAIGKPMWAFAFPFGDSDAVSPREPGLAQQAGFTCAFMNVQNCVPTRFSYPRVHVAAGMSLGEFEAHVSGFHLSLRARYAFWGASA